MRTRIMRYLLITILLSLGIGMGVGCSEKPADKPLASASETAASTNTSGTVSTNTAAGSNQVFQVKGVIQRLELEKKKAIIKHEEIPNYMPEMTMPFDVRNTNEIAELSPGDEVTFTMIVTEDDGWIENIKRTGETKPVGRAPIRVVRNVEELEEGDIMPDYPFTNAVGKAVRLYDHKGKALALTFIFTRCPFPTFCPRMSNNFAETARLLTNNPAGPTNWHMFSISFDPDYDTPAKLRAYSKIYGADPEKWDFVSGAQIEIDAITEQFGLGFAYNEGKFDHNLRTAVIDAAGKVHKIFVGNEWTPEQLAEAITQAAQVKATPASPEVAQPANK